MSSEVFIIQGSKTSGFKNKRCSLYVFEINVLKIVYKNISGGFGSLNKLGNKDKAVLVRGATSEKEFNGKPNTLCLAFGQRATADVNIGGVGIIKGGSVITQKCGDVY